MLSKQLVQINIVKHLAKLLQNFSLNMYLQRARGNYTTSESSNFFYAVSQPLEFCTATGA